MIAERPRILCPINVEDEELYVSGAVDDHGGLTFWLERPDGRAWREISEPAHCIRGVDIRREIVAAASAGEKVIRAAMSTGWFVRTGRNVQHPASANCEVWALTDACRQMFADVGLLLDESVAKKGAHALNAAAPAPDLSLYDLLNEMMAQLRGSSITATVITVANPFSSAAGARLLVASFPDSLRRCAGKFEGGELKLRPKPLVECHQLVQLPGQPWAKHMLESGFKSVVALRIPVASEYYIECLMFGTSHLMDEAYAAKPVWTAMKYFPQLKQATSNAVCNLTPRERECLISAFDGNTAPETADEVGCSARTARMHFSNAMLKLGCDNKISAIQRAQMLGII